VFEVLERLLKSDEVVSTLRVVEINVGEEMGDDDWYITKLE